MQTNLKLSVLAVVAVFGLPSMLHAQPAVPAGTVEASDTKDTDSSAAQETAGQADSQADASGGGTKSLGSLVVEVEKDPTTYSIADGVRSGSKIDIPLKDVPQTVNVVSQQLIRDTSANSMADTLSYVPGVSTSTGDGHRDQVMIRGFLNINDWYVDGYRDDALYYRDLANIERVEVIKGPSAALYGRGSPGGIVNRITKKPDGLERYELALKAGTHDQYRTEVDLGGTLTNDDSIEYRLTGAVEDSHSFRNKFYLKRQAISPSVRFNLDDDTDVLLQFNYLYDKRPSDQGVVGNPATGRPVDTKRDIYYGSSDTKQQQFNKIIVKDFTAQFNHSFSDNLKWKNTFRTYDYMLQRNYATITANPGSKIASFNPYTDQVSFTRTRRNRDERGIDFISELEHDFDLGSTHHKVLYGAELDHQRKVERQWPGGNYPGTNNSIMTYNAYSPRLVKAPPLDEFNIKRDFDTDINQVSAYVQDLMTITPQWKLMASLRYDHINQDKADSKPGGTGAQHRKDNTWSPRLGLTYQPIDPLSFYASWGKSYQPIAESYVFRGNSDELKPQKTENYEVGMKWETMPDSFLTVSLFHMVQSDIPNASENDPNVAVIAGKQKSDGLEVSYQGTWDKFDWDLGYAWLNAKITDSNEKYRPNSCTLVALSGSKQPCASVSYEGNRASLSPRNSAHALLKYHINDNWYVMGAAKYEGKRYVSNTNNIALPSYTKFDVGAGYESKHMDVNLTVNNVFDRKYFVAGHNAADDYNLYGDPAEAFLTVRFKY